MNSTVRVERHRDGLFGTAGKYRVSCRYISKCRISQVLCYRNASKTSPGTKSLRFVKSDKQSRSAGGNEILSWIFKAWGKVENTLCCEGIDSAGIAEDDIPRVPAQPLPATEQQLPRIMNPLAHTWWHPPLARLRKDCRREPVL